MQGIYRESCQSQEQDVVGPDHPVDMGGLAGGGAGTTQQGDAVGGPRSSSGGSSSGIVGPVAGLPSLPASSPYQTTQGSTGPADGSAREGLVDRLRDFDGEEQVVFEGNAANMLGRHRIFY